MKLFINDSEIEIPRSEMILARNAVNSFLAVANKSAKASGNPILYTTTLLMMYAKSTELINELGIENIRYIMERYKRDTKQENSNK